MTTSARPPWDARMRTARNFLLGIVLALGVYVGYYFLFPPSLSLKFGASTASSLFYCRLFYPLRWATERQPSSYTASVEKIDFENRNLLLMVSPKLGYFLPFHAGDEATIRSLHTGDRIRVRIERLPNRDAFTCHDEFLGYTLIQ